MPFKLNHLHLKTRDPQKTAQFYVDTLGAKVTSVNPNGGCRIDLHGLSINVTQFFDSQTRHQTLGMEHIAIDSDEYDSVVTKGPGREDPGRDRGQQWPARLLLRRPRWCAARIHRDEVLISEPFAGRSP